MTVLGIILGLLMGAVLGLLGGGGSILTVPILLYAFGVAAKPAIATSLLVVGVTSLVAVAQHARQGHVRWQTGAPFGAFAMAGAFAGGSLAAWIPGSALLILFAGAMAAAAVAMLRGHEDDDDGRHAPVRSVATWKVAVQGLLVGAFTGLVGAGGGFLVVPALVMIGGLPMRHAVGTSLLVIALNSFAGLAGYLGHVTIDPTPAAVLTLAAVVGSLAGGGTLAARVHPGALRRTFAWFVLAAGVVMLAHQLAPARWHPAPPVLLGAVLVLLLALPLQRCVAHGKKTP